MLQNDLPTVILEQRGDQEGCLASQTPCGDSSLVPRKGHFDTCWAQHLLKCKEKGISDLYTDCLLQTIQVFSCAQCCAILAPRGT